MYKLTLTNCKICGKEVTSRGFSFHISNTHKMTVEDYIIKYEYGGNHPLCKCGCGEKVTIRGYQIMEYVNHHCPDANFDLEKCKSRSEKWKENVKIGIQKWNKEAKEKDPNYRKGEKNIFYGHKHSIETKEKLKNLTKQQIKDGKHSFIGKSKDRITRSSLEIKFENYLNSINLSYTTNYKIGCYLEGRKYISYRYYDFYLPIFNCLVEIHGTYWHPEELSKCKNDIQIKNYNNDIFKKQLAKKNKYFILTIYDYQLDNFISNNEIFALEKFINNKDLILSNITTESIIPLPEYWTGLVDEDTITVNLTSKNKKLHSVVGISSNTVEIECVDGEVDCYFMILGERKDVAKLEVEY